MNSESRTGLATFLENDGASVTLGQARFGVGRGTKNILGLLLGRGIGSRILINGEIYHGLSSTARGIDHLTVNPNGSACVSGAAIAESAREGDEIAIELMLQAADHIGMVLADTINILNPEMVVMGGGLVGARDSFIDRIKAVTKMRAYTFC